MKNHFLISDSEKSRILNLHESRKPHHGTSLLNEGTIIDVSKCFSDNGIKLETLENVPDCKKFDVDAPGRCVSQIMKLDNYVEKSEQFDKIWKCVMNTAKNNIDKMTKV